MSRLKIGLALVLLLVVVVAIGFVTWASSALGPMPEALVALESDAQVAVLTEPWLVFRPVGEAGQVGLILYPGGRVDARAYAPAARAIAAAGYPVVIVPMPLNLAIFGADRALEVIDAFPEVERWAIGGHSLGGAMAARFARANPGTVDGLVLWASYPTAGDDLSASQLAVASIYGTRDGLAAGEEVEASRRLLPANTTWAPIKGGNHAQFGWYGVQGGDGEPAITRGVQQAQVVAATVALLEAVEGR